MRELWKIQIKLKHETLDEIEPRSWYDKPVPLETQEC